MTSKNRVPVDFAIASGNVPAICWFLENGGRNDNLANRFDPVAYAVASEQLESVECLLNYGYDVNREAFIGLNPLMASLDLENRDIAETLVSAGAAWQFDSWLFERCLAKAVNMDSVEILSSALDQGVAIDSLLFDSWSLLDIANHYNLNDIIQYLNTMSAAEVEGAFVSSAALDEKLHVVERVPMVYSIENQRTYGSRTLKVKVGINGKGRVCLFEFEETVPDILKRLVESALSDWVFSAPSVNGKAVGVSLHLSIPLKASSIDDEAFGLADVDEPPSRKRHGSVVYPAALVANRIEGRVQFEFIIDENGEVRKIRAVSFTHPALTLSKTQAGELPRRMENRCHAEFEWLLVLIFRIF